MAPLLGLKESFFIYSVRVQCNYDFQFITLGGDSGDGFHLAQVNFQPLRVSIHCTPTANALATIVIFKIKTCVTSQRPPTTTCNKQQTASVMK